jgi:anti-anti-sigma factor
MDIRIIQTGELTEVHAAGRLDGHWSATLGNALEELIREGRHRVCLRLGEVEYISSLGLRVLVTAHKQFRGVSGQFSVADVADNVARVLELAGLSQLLLHADSTPEAATALRPARTFAHSGARIDLYGTVGAGMQGGLIGSPGWLRTFGYRAEDCHSLAISPDLISVGLGAFGTDFRQCRTRFGEYLAVAGAAVTQPGDGSYTCDSLVTTGAFEPTVQMLYGLCYRGVCSAQFRFEPDTAATIGAASTRLPAADSTRPADLEADGGITLSALAEAALKAIDAQAACIVFMAESDGLIGATLRASPGTLREGVDPLVLPDAQRWLSVTHEPAHARSTVVATGVIARPGALPDESAVLRPLGPNGGIEGHVHAAVYRFRPLKHGQLDLAETLRPLFEHAPADTVMHLLGDDRDEGRAPAESRFMRGVCWVSPIRSIPATNSGRSAGQQETAA